MSECYNHGISECPVCYPKAEEVRRCAREGCEIELRHWNESGMCPKHTSSKPEGEKRKVRGGEHRMTIFRVVVPSEAVQ